MSTKPRIRSMDYSGAFPDRIAVWKLIGTWLVERGAVSLGRFPTHAEAIAFADQHARNNTRTQIPERLS